MFGGFVVEAVMRVSGNAITYMNSYTASVTKADIATAQLTGKISNAEARWLRHSAAVDAAARSHARLAAAISGTIALAGAATIWNGLKDAGELQRALTAVAINTPGANQDSMRRMVLSVSSMTAQSATTIANELATVASSGIKDPRQLQTLFPLFAKAADVGYLSPKHLDPVETIRTLAQFSHVFGVYQGKPLEQMVNSAMRLMSVQPEGLQQMLTQGRLFVGNALSRGVPMDEVFRIFALMGQTGFLRGRGGSGVENVMDYLEGAESVTNHMSKVRRAAFLDLSRQGAAHGLGAMFDADGRLRFIDKEGNLHLMDAVQYLAKLSNYMDKGKFSNDLVDAFGKQGRNFLSVATRPAVQEQMRRNAAAYNATPGIDSQWSSYMGNFLGQLSVFGTNFKNVLINVFYPVLPYATKVFKVLADDLGNLSNFLASHPGLAGMIAGFIGSLTASATLAAIGFGIQALSIPASLQAIAAAVNGFGATMATDAGAIGASSVVASAGVGRVGLAILGLARILANPLVQGAIAVSAGFLYGVYNGVKDHPYASFQASLANRGIGDYNNPATFYNPDRNDAALDYYRDTPVSKMIADGRRGDIHVDTVVVQANSLDQLMNELKLKTRHIRAKQGATRTAPLDPFGAASRFLPGYAH